MSRLLFPPWILFRRCSLLALLLFFLAFEAAAGQSGQSAQPVHVGFVNPDYRGDPFWDSVTEVLLAAADNLGMKLEVRYGEGNRLRSTEEALSLLKEPGLDYLLTIFQSGQGGRILSAAESAGTPVFFFNTDIPESDTGRVGIPGQIFTQWIGHLVPDDRQAGRLLGSELREAAVRNALPMPLKVVGFTGSRESTPSRLRVEGLGLAVRAQSDLDLQQVVYSNWEPEITAQQLPVLLKRYPQTSVIWSASDGMALAAISAAEQIGLVPGRDVIGGGIDWTENAIQAVAEGRLAVTVGGHFMDGAWSLVLLHDFHHGLVRIREMQRVMSRFQAINQGNVQHYLPLLNKKRWKSFDFRAFSRAVRGAEAPYVFGLDTILDDSLSMPAAGKTSGAD